MKLSLKDILDKDYSRNILKILDFVDNMDEIQMFDLGLAGKTPLGYGDVAAVYPSLNKDVVIKINADDRDFDFIQRLKDSKHVAPVHNTKKIQDNEGNSYNLMYVQKMNKIEDDILDALENLFDRFKEEIDQEFKAKKEKEEQRKSKLLLKKIRGYCRDNAFLLSDKEKKYLRGMARAIKDFHDHNFVFSDKKAKQFMLDKKGKIKLVDYGALSNMEDPAMFSLKNLLRF